MKKALDAFLVGEFETAEQIVSAARELREMGYDTLDAFTPYPLLALEKAIGLRRSGLGWVVFPCALLGAAGAYLLQWWTAAVDYPLDVGGRPAHAAPAFVPITFEMAILSAGLTSLVALIVCSGLPALHQPIFEVPGIDRASIDRFFLYVGATEPPFEKEVVGARLLSLGALRVEAVGFGEATSEEGGEA